MKTKISAILLVIIISLLAFASCKKCEHPLLDEWESDDEYHWHPTECEHGEFRSEPEAHVDVDQNKVCDECGQKVVHKHTYSENWTITETEHWREATCVHTEEKGDRGFHVDDDLNGKCEKCGTHVHILDGAGFCAGCNKEIVPVEEGDIGSVISATTARTHNVVSAVLDYYQISRLANSNGVIEHTVDYFFGTNGIYSKRYYAEVNQNGASTGKTELMEKWIKKLSATSVSGITVESVDGKVKDAYPSDFSISDLAGDYYAISLQVTITLSPLLLTATVQSFCFLAYIRHTRNSALMRRQSLRTLMLTPMSSPSTHSLLRPMMLPTMPASPRRYILPIITRYLLHLRTLTITLLRTLLLT